MWNIELFEWMDQNWLPSSIRLTLRDALECALSIGRRGSYYGDVANSVLTTLRSQGLSTVVELGAGSAPITRHLASRADLPAHVKLTVCDLTPDIEGYRALEKQHPDRVHAILEPVDFSQSIPFGPECLLVLSANFHHLPRNRRVAVLRNLKSRHTVIHEALGPSWMSLAATALLLFPALFAPLRYLAWEPERPGHLRRIFWCWLVPITVPLLIWDGVVSWLRCWGRWEWTVNLNAALGQRIPYRISFHTFGTWVQW